MAGPIDVEGKTWSIFVSRSPSSLGGGAAYFAMNFIEESGWFKTGLSQLEIVFVQNGAYVPFFSKGAVFRDGSNGQREKWERYVASLPKRRFLRKTGKLALELRGDPAFDCEDKIYLNNITCNQIRIAASMIHHALAYINGTLKPVDDIDLAKMTAAAAFLVSREWQSDEAMRKDLAVACDLDRARIAAMNPWLKIDMNGFHKKARNILDQPSDWSQGDDFSPHGNDLGAEILGDWANCRNGTVDNVAKRFEIDLTRNPDSASMERMQIALALAFGHIKKTGACPSDLALLTLQILKSDRDQAAKMVPANHLAAWNTACNRYTSILKSLV